MLEYGPSVFGVHLHPKRVMASDWRVANGTGRMRSTGVAGGITGRGADCLIIDDPIKDAKEANSEVVREGIWDWYTTTARTRLEPNGIIIVIQTRWHAEDLIGRLRIQAERGGEQWHSVTLPAIAGPDDPLGREEGDALWPDRYDLQALLSIRDTSPAHWWNALYQQRPTPPGGGIAQSAWFKAGALPVGEMRYCRFWDCAGTDKAKLKRKSSDPDWTVGAKLARAQDGRIFIVDIIRVQASAGDVDKLILNTAMRDGVECAIREEQEPGASGLAMIVGRKRRLAGYNYDGQKPLGKPDGWRPMLIQAEVGNVYTLAGDWNQKFFAEVDDAPFGSHDDQLDAVSGAFHYLTIGTSAISAADILSIGSGEDELRSALARQVF